MKKPILLFAAALLIACLLAACGKEKPDETTVPSDPAGATTEQSGTKDTGSTQPEETSEPEPESESETETQATDALPASARRWRPTLTATSSGWCAPTSGR